MYNNIDDDDDENNTMYDPQQGLSNCGTRTTSGTLATV
jgi:hypothetical protein